MKNTIATFAMAAIMTLGATFANAGIIVSDFVPTTPNPCSTHTTKQETGIIVSDLIGIIVSDFTGIIVSDSPVVNCGIIVSD